MTAMSRELAHKRPAEVVRQQPKTINGRVVRKFGAGRLIAHMLLITAAVLFAGFLISMTQQYL
jgi:hypothetical protein